MPRSAGRTAAALAVVLVLGACDSAADDDGEEPGSAAPAGEPDEDDADNDGSEDDGEGPRSEVETEEVDSPRTVAEIRVGEIIADFDGEVVDEGTLLIIEEPILFDFDSARLKDSARVALDEITEVLEFYGDAPVQVVGHTDDVGSAAYNLDLSQRRADSVTEALLDRGIDAGRITAEGRGLEEPIASNDTEEGRAHNRRVEALIEGVEPPDTD